MSKLSNRRACGRRCRQRCRRASWCFCGCRCTLLVAHAIVRGRMQRGVGDPHARLHNVCPLEFTLAPQSVRPNRQRRRTSALKLKRKACLCTPAPALALRQRKPVDKGVRRPKVVCSVAAAPCTIACRAVQHTEPRDAVNPRVAQRARVGRARRLSRRAAGSCRWILFAV